MRRKSTFNQPSQRHQTMALEKQAKQLIPGFEQFVACCCCQRMTASKVNQSSLDIGVSEANTYCANFAYDSLGLQRCLYEDNIMSVVKQSQTALISKLPKTLSIIIVQKHFGLRVHFRFRLQCSALETTAVWNRIECRWQNLSAFKHIYKAAVSECFLNKTRSIYYYRTLYTFIQEAY